MIKKLLIANRGEIAIRIAQAKFGIGRALLAEQHLRRDPHPGDQVLQHGARGRAL